MKNTTPSVIASIILPLIILVSFWTWINKSIPEDPASLPAKIQEIDKRLSESQPDVILVGSSLVSRAVDNKLFAKELGIPEEKVQKLWSGMATMPAVNLMIENRVLHQNLQPKVIAILCPPKWLAHSEVLQDAHFAMHQTRPLNPTIAEVLGLEQAADSRPWKQRKSNFQDGYQEWNQELFGEMVLGESQTDIDNKLDSLFAFENQRQNVKGSQLIQHNTRETEAEQDENSTDNDFDLRLLKSIASQLEEQNIQLVIVSLPVSKVVKHAYTLSDEEMVQVIDTLQQYGASFIDVYDWEDKNVFGDNKHMNARGRKLFTPILAAEWNEMGILTDTPKTAEVPLKFKKPTISIPEGSQLTGQSSLILTFPTNLSKATFKACLSSEKPITGFAFEQTTSRTNGELLWCEELILTNITANQPITVQNQSDATLSLHSFMLGDIQLLTLPRTILASPKGWTLHTSQNKPSATITESEKLTKWMIRKKDSYPSLQVGTLNGFKGMSDQFLTPNGIPAECRPIEITAVNEPIPLNKCRNIWNKNSGYCLQKNSLIALQDSPVQWGSLQVHLKENRLCKIANQKVPSGYWFLPGDSSSTTFNWPKGVYSRIAIDGSSLGKGTWHVELFAKETIFVDTILTEPLTEEIELMLQQPLLEKHNDVQIRISIPSDSTAKVFIRRIELKN